MTSACGWTRREEARQWWCDVAGKARTHIRKKPKPEKRKDRARRAASPGGAAARHAKHRHALVVVAGRHLWTSRLDARTRHPRPTKDSALMGHPSDVYSCADKGRWPGAFRGGLAPSRFTTVGSDCATAARTAKARRAAAGAVAALRATRWRAAGIVALRPKPPTILRGRKRRGGERTTTTAGGGEHRWDTPHHPPKDNRTPRDIGPPTRQLVCCASDESAPGRLHWAGHRGITATHLRAEAIAIAVLSVPRDLCV